MTIEIQCFEGDGEDPLLVYLASIGCQEAIDTMRHRGWRPATKGQHAEFRWELGDVLDYKGGKATRTIIGYALDGKGDTIYVIKTEKGNINFKTTREGNKKYGPRLRIDQTVINGLRAP